MEDRYFVTNLVWNRLKGEGILALVRAHWGIENQGFRTLDMEWEEDYGRPWCSQGWAVDVLGYLRLLAYNVLQLAKGRYWRRRYRDRTLRSFVAEVVQAFVEERAVQRALRAMRPGSSNRPKVLGFQTGEGAEHSQGIGKAGRISEGSGLPL